MLGTRQFSLGYLLLEIFWVAAALGSFRAIMALPEEYAAAGPPLLLAAVVAVGAALGGVFGQMRWGAVLAVLLALVSGLLLLPAVMTA
jgi:hypothetical protein